MDGQRTEDAQQEPGAEHQRGGGGDHPAQGEAESPSTETEAER